MSEQMTDPRSKHPADEFPMQEQDQPGLTDATDADARPRRGVVRRLRPPARPARADHRRRLRHRPGGGDRLRAGGRGCRDRAPAGGAGGCRWTRCARSTTAGRKGVALAGDLRDEEFAVSIVDDTVTAFGGLDILVLNAAYQKDRDSLETLEHRRVRPRLPDQPLRADLHGRGRRFRTSARARRSS